MSKSLYTILIFICLHLSVTAQEKEQAVAEKATPRMSLISTQLNTDSVLIETTIRVKVEGAWQPVDFELVKFSTLNDTIAKPIGESLTSDKGVASVKVGRNQLFMSSDSVWMIGSVFDGNEKLEAGEASLSIKPAMATLSGEVQDSIFSLTLKLFDAGFGNPPLADVEVGFYVKRHFSNLKIGEGTTDENGEVTIECPGDIPGDADGNIVLIGKAEDFDEYGSIAAVVVKPWGVPLQESDQKITRALWAHAPPVWMLVTFIILMSVVWGHYIVIIYKLIKLRKPKIQNP